METLKELIPLLIKNFATASVRSLNRVMFSLFDATLSVLQPIKNL